MQNEKWDQRFMDVAKLIGTWSKDRSRGIGCVIVSSERDILATGYNGLPRGVDDTVEERFERPGKYIWTEHAERNAIYAAAKYGTALQDLCTIYTPLFPCMDCARAIIQSGIVRMVTYRPDFQDPQWGASFRVVLEMLQEVDFMITYLDPA